MWPDTNWSPPIVCTIPQRTSEKTARPLLFLVGKLHGSDLYFTEDSSLWIISLSSDTSIMHLCWLEDDAFSLMTSSALHWSAQTLKLVAHVPCLIRLWVLYHKPYLYCSVFCWCLFRWPKWRWLLMSVQCWEFFFKFIFILVPFLGFPLCKASRYFCRSFRSSHLNSYVCHSSKPDTILQRSCTFGLWNHVTCRTNGDF